MERFGFDRQPQLDLPARPMCARQRRVAAAGLAVARRQRLVDVGRMAIGQDRLQVTPLQMAMVAAAVANGGKLMKPHLGDRIVDRDGRTSERIEPEEQSRR